MMWLWIKLAAFIGLAGIWGAQIDTLPPLASNATDPSGAIMFFYPADWGMIRDESQLFLYEGGSPGAAEQIVIEAEVLADAPDSFESLPEWFIEENDLSVDAASLFSQEQYGGFDAWLLQGEDLLQEDDYSAAVLILIQPGQVGVIQTNFPTERLVESAALVTAILQDMVILPVSAAAQEGNLRLNLPFNWFQAEGITSFYAAPAEADLRSVTREEAPSDIGISVRFATGPDNLDEFLASSTALTYDRVQFEVNGTPSVILLRQDNTTEPPRVELVIARARGTGAFIEMRAYSASADYLLEERATLQAIFSSIEPQ